MSNKIKTFSGEVRAEGRVTIPSTVRERLGIEEGDFVVLDVVKAEDSMDAVKQANEGY